MKLKQLRRFLVKVTTLHICTLDSEVLKVEQHKMIANRAILLRVL
jgi:hypothetical protein